MISEKFIERDVKGIGRGLLLGTIPGYLTVCHVKACVCFHAV
jgi:hypothetical protein